MKGRDRRRGLYAPDDMARLIAPQSVAVVGVSERPNAFGSRTIANMKAFDGRVYQINAKHSELAGRPCYPNIAALPETPDCVVIATPREAVEPIARECAARGVGSILVFAAGFAETGKPEHVALQRRLLAIAQDANMRLVGPNSIGLVNYAIGAGLTFSAMPDRRPLQAHAIGIVEPVRVAWLLAGPSGGTWGLGEPRPDRRKFLRRRCGRSGRLSRSGPKLPGDRLPV